MSINCYSRFFKQQLLLFFSIAANMLTCSMTWWYWLVYIVYLLNEKQNSFSLFVHQLNLRLVILILTQTICLFPTNFMHVLCTKNQENFNVDNQTVFVLRGMQWLQKCMQQFWCRSIYCKYWIEDAEFLPDKTQYLSLICLVLEVKFIFSKLDSLIESMQCINLSELN